MSRCIDENGSIRGTERKAAFQGQRVCLDATSANVKLHIEVPAMWQLLLMPSGIIADDCDLRDPACAAETKTHRKGQKTKMDAPDDDGTFPKGSASATEKRDRLRRLTGLMEGAALTATGQKVLLGNKLDPISEMVPLLQQLVSSRSVPGSVSSTRGIHWLQNTAGSSEALATFARLHQSDPRILGMAFVDFTSGQATGKRRRASEWSGSFGGRVSFRFKDRVPEVGIVDSKFTAKDPEKRDGPCGNCLVQRVRLVETAPLPPVSLAVVQVEQIAGASRATQGKGRALPMTRFHFAGKNPFKRESGKHVLTIVLETFVTEEHLATYCAVRNISMTRLQAFKKALEESQGVVQKSFSKGDNDDEPEAVQMTGFESLEVEAGAPTMFNCSIVNQMIADNIVAISMREDYVLSNEINLFFVFINSPPQTAGSMGYSDSDSLSEASSLNDLDRAMISYQAQDETVRQATGHMGSPPTRPWGTMNLLRVCLGEREAAIWERYPLCLRSYKVNELFSLMDESVRREDEDSRNTARDIFISLLGERENQLRGET
ncbi:hypothetical protein BSKO_13485 [Bryopsis sp. KO-2023]|nr:hypothetical protein BSKO_13485 [Bryopsis sp. KO-2023]